MGSGPWEISGKIHRVPAPIRQQVLDLLRLEIVEGRLQPGTRLVEREIAEWTGTSRATVREAIRHLAAEGLVAPVHPRGLAVAVPNEKAIRELYQVRAYLEQIIATSFTTNAQPAERDLLASHVEAFIQTQDLDVELTLAAKERLYGTLIQGAGHSVAAEFLTQLQARIAMFRRASLRRPGRKAETVAEIRAIAEAIDRNAPEEAGKAAYHHVMCALDAALKTFSA
jgi:GntR family transcriptional regulator, trigonelline degradation regulator